MNKVNNGPIARLFRTIGYLLIVLSALLLSAEYVGFVNVKFLNDLLGPVNKFLTDNIPNFISGNKFLILSGGLLILVWTQTTSVIVRILLTLVGVATFLGFNDAPSNSLISFKLFEIKFLKDLFSKEWMPLVFFLLTMFPIYLILAYRKPNRLSSQTTASGILLIILAFVFTALSYGFKVPFMQTAWFHSVINWTYLIGYIVTVVGGLFGILALFNK